MSGHTPGPWKIVPIIEGFRKPGEDGAKDMAILGADGMCPGIIWDGVIGDTQNANARLIAAAPDLLSLLIELTDIEGPLPGNAAWAQKVKAAVAKATQS